MEEKENTVSPKSYSTCHTSSSYLLGLFVWAHFWLPNLNKTMRLTACYIQSNQCFELSECCNASGGTDNMVIFSWCNVYHTQTVAKKLEIITVHLSFMVKSDLQRVWLNLIVCASSTCWDHKFPVSSPAFKGSFKPSWTASKSPN